MASRLVQVPASAGVRYAQNLPSGSVLAFWRCSNRNVRKSGFDFSPESSESDDVVEHSCWQAEERCAWWLQISGDCFGSRGCG